MAQIFERSFGAPKPDSAAQLNKILKNQPAERIKVIRSLETDFVTTLELLFDISDQQRDAMSDLRLTGMDRVAALAASEALRQGHEVEFKIERANEGAPPVTLRLQVETQRPNATHRPSVTVIVWCICRF